MDIIFAEGKYTGELTVPQSIINKLPKRVGLVSSIQFIDHLIALKFILEKAKIQVFIGKGIQAFPGQVLGCDASSALAINDKVDAFFYLGDGKFHPLNVAYKTNKEVFCFDPLVNDLSVITLKDIEKHKTLLTGKYSKFLMSSSIGIIISTKSGQSKMNEAIKFKDSLIEKGKSAYLFLADNVNIDEFDNYPFIEYWVNTACSRIPDEKKGIINMEDILSFESNNINIK